VAERRPPLIELGGVPVTPPPGAFLQATAEGEAALVRLVSEACAGAGRIADLYAGIGTFSFALARAAPVYAAEQDAAAVAALVAARNGAAGLKQIEAEMRDLVRRPLGPGELARFDAVVFDPPRAGAARQVEELARSKVPLVVAVSCNPATFARDSRTLADGGYRLERVTPVDQFLWSAHVELVATFRR
ncbi:MAG TPA: RNA methyltransferase, partial [Alphaproteobacteria bacterium]|nr:RNA methyltransferase [Alphaproteobacteria bacterium]